MNPIYLIDFYKVGHIHQYPPGIERVYSNWTPRATRVPDCKAIVSLGIQYLEKEILIKEFQENFFNRDWLKIVDEYRKFIRATLGIVDPWAGHLRDLYTLGYLPIEIWSLPEGLASAPNIPHAVITNTLPEFFWLPNYLETILSNILWKPSTSATTAKKYRGIFEKWARKYGEKNLGFVAWQGHDFSFRGMSGREDAMLSGLGHLSCFNGTDTVPAIWAAHNYYGAEFDCGGSVPATEHSVMCAGGVDGEKELFERLITQVYPDGIVSIVSDTWDLWKVLTSYIPELKEIILGRNGKVVIRPDSGDPELILCGDPSKSPASPEGKGALRLLAEAMGAKDGMIQGCGLIYGDSITPERADKILSRCVEEIGLSPFNLVFGIGSYTYEYVTRDTHYFAMKATGIEKKGKVIPIFKSPITDDGRKKSHKGILAVYRTEESTEADPDFFVLQETDYAHLSNCALQLTFRDGKLYNEVSWKTIQDRVRR